MNYKLTFVDHPFLPSNDADAAPPVVDAKLTPLPHAIRLFTEIIRNHLRLRVASHKTLLFQPPLPDGDRRALPRLLHLFPNGSRVSDSCFVLAGSPVGTVAGVAAKLSDALIAFNEAARKLLELPLLYPQLRVLILTLCLRPSSKFAHLLRHLPPSATADVSLPEGP